jgi:plastocyanin
MPGAATDVRWITSLLASFTLAMAACAPPVATRSTLPPQPAKPARSVSPSAVAATAARGQSAAATSEVKIVEPAFRPPQEWAYIPTELSIKLGTTVVWTNSGAVAHTVTADDGTSFDSGSIDPKATFTLMPAAAGTFAYHCTFHPWMKATLIVTP